MKESTREPNTSKQQGHSDETMDLINRAVLEARADKSFWDKYKALIIGGAAAIPIQLVALWF